MKLIDMHCDTAMKLLSQPEMDLCSPSLEVNLPALIQAHSMVEFLPASLISNHMPLPLHRLMTMDIRMFWI